MTRANGRMLTTMERLRLVACVLVRRLPCGCEAGMYQTTTRQLLTIIDDPEDACPDRGHQADFVIAEQDLMAPAAQSQGEAA